MRRYQSQHNKVLLAERWEGSENEDFAKFFEVCGLPAQSILRADHGLKIMFQSEDGKIITIFSGDWLLRIENGKYLTCSNDFFQTVFEPYVDRRSDECILGQCLYRYELQGGT